MLSEEKEKIEMFNDDSKAFKLLYNELKDVKDVIVHDIKDVVVQDFKDTDDYLLNIYQKASGKVKTYLHYTSDDLRDNNESKRRAIEKVERVGFKNKVVLPYEGLDNQTLEARYDKFTKDAVNIPEKPYISVSGKPTAISMDSPTGAFTINKDNEVKVIKDDNVKEEVKKKPRFRFPV